MTDSEKGLAGITAADSALSFIDGEEGRLFYRGYDIHALAGQGSFTEALYLLWYGELPTRTALVVFEGLLAQERRLPPEVEAVLRALPGDVLPMSALGTAVSVLGGIDDDAGYNNEEADFRKAGRIVSTLPVAVAAHHRLHLGLQPIEPDQNLSLAADFLRMLTGEMPDDISVKALDTSMLLYLEHGLNASTFACRVVASTLADLHAAVTAGVAALSGPLHGGANEQAMRMLDEIGSIDQVDEYLDHALANKHKIMGFGHRVYRGEDPRATHLRRMADELGAAFGSSATYKLSRAVEIAMLEKKGLHCNVDFYCASVYRSLGIPLALFTPLFAIGRSGGWAAHVMEQHRDNRLIRPRTRYTGESARQYIQTDQRNDRILE
ncbi:MAG: citrate synthase [Gemmatimonadales bacterium]|nr:MAG: citrate synthase [Gemmatimonadales bacterium]